MVKTDGLGNDHPWEAYVCLDSVESRVDPRQRCDILSVTTSIWPFFYASYKNKCFVFLTFLLRKKFT